jgi:hypothetical protein
LAFRILLPYSILLFALFLRIFSFDFVSKTYSNNIQSEYLYVNIVFNWFLIVSFFGAVPKRIKLLSDQRKNELRVLDSGALSTGILSALFFGLYFSYHTQKWEIFIIEILALLSSHFIRYYSTDLILSKSTIKYHLINDLNPPFFWIILIYLFRGIKPVVAFFYARIINLVIFKISHSVKITSINSTNLINFLKVQFWPALMTLSIALSQSLDLFFLENYGEEKIFVKIGFATRVFIIAFILRDVFITKKIENVIKNGTSLNWWIVLASVITFFCGTSLIDQFTLFDNKVILMSLTMRDVLVTFLVLPILYLSIRLDQEIVHVVEKFHGFLLIVLYPILVCLSFYFFVPNSLESYVKLIGILYSISVFVKGFYLKTRV